MPAPSAQSAPSAKQDGLTIITPPAIASYAYVWKPTASMKAGGEPQYRITLIFPKGTDLSKLRGAAKLAATNRWGAKLPSGLKLPFRNGDTDRPDDPLFKGSIFVTARTNTKPGIVDKNVQPILDEMEFYSGCKCKASLYAFAFDTNGNRGVSFLLNNLQKLGEGERLSGRRSAEDEFSEEESEDGEDDDPFA
jgi:hypothetical protein